MNTSQRRDFLKATGMAALGLPALSFCSEENPTDRLFPKPLPDGATIGLVSPASYIWNQEKAEKAIKDFEDKGYTIKRGASLFDEHGYFAGKDEDRVKDINAFFADDEVDAIFALTGGWGSARLLTSLDYEVIRQNPKILLGYSDITALHLGIYSQTGLVTFHGPNGLSDWNEFTTSNFQKVLIENKKVQWEGSPENEKDFVKGRFTIHPGKAKGRLVGGNLTVMSCLVGSPYMPDCKDAILFLEDIGEAVYRIDRYLVHLKLAGILDQVAGIIFGSCNDCEPEDDKHTFSLREALELNLKSLGKPCFFGSPFGHIKEKYTFPHGVEVEMDAEKGLLQMTEQACKV